MRRSSRQRGLSLAESLVSLAISVVLLVAITGATVASFRAYGDAVEQAGTQVSTRMVMQRILALIRTSTAHGPLQAETGATINGNTITSNHLELVDPNGDIVRCEYRASDDELWLILNPGTGETAQPLLSGVTAASLSLLRRQNDDGIWVLERASIDLTVQPDEEQTLAIENGPAQSVRLIASTMLRKLE